MDTLHQPTLETLRLLRVDETAELAAVGTKDILEVIAYITEHHDRGFEPTFFINRAIIKRVK